MGEISLPKTEIAITFGEMKRASEEELKRSKSFSKEIESKYNIQVKKEKDFVSHFQWKSPPYVDRKHILAAEEIVAAAFARDDIVVSKQKGNHTKEHKSRFLDSESLEHLSYVARNIIVFDGPQFRTGYNFIRRLITDVRLIGAPSESGFIMSAGLFKKYKDLLVIKAPKYESAYTRESVIHELAVGKILNSLRPIIPNFAFVLGSFDCGPPIIKPSPDPKSDKGTVVSWCRGGSPVKYLIYENISESKSLYDFVETCSPQEYLDAIIQLNYALMVAFKETGFTHYDLHGNNILVRDLKQMSHTSKEGFYIPYQGDFVFATSLFTIIDYGFSHVYLPGTNESIGAKSDAGPRGNVYYLQSGIYLDRPNPFADCYRLLNATLRTMRKYNHTTYDKVKSLLHFFHPQTEDIDAHFNGEDASYTTYFGSPEYMENVKKFKSTNFIKYCREFCALNDLDDPVVSGKDYTTEIDDSLIFSGPSFDIIDLLNDETTINKKEIVTIDNLFDLIEPILVYRNYLTSNERSIGREKIKNHQEISRRVYDKILSHSDHYKILLDQEFNSLEREFHELRVPKYIGVPEIQASILREPLFFKNYTDSLEQTTRYVDKFDLLERKYEMADFICQEVFHFPKGNTSHIRDLIKRKDDRKIIFSFIKRDVNTIFDYIATIPSGKLDSMDTKIELVGTSLFSILPHDEQ